MPSGGARRNAGRKRAINDPALIVEIAFAFEREWHRVAFENAYDNIAHRVLSQRLEGVKDPNARKKIIGGRRRVMSARLKRPWALRDSIFADLARRYGVSERQIQHCVSLIPPCWPPSGYEKT
jgi:hypothetical protein